MKKIMLLLAFMLALLQTSSHSQTFNVSLEWTREFNFEGTNVFDNFWGMVLDSAGNIFINGGSSSPIYSSALMKRDSNGNLVWSRTDTMNNSSSSGGQNFCLESKNKIGYFSENSQGKWFITRNKNTGNIIEIVPKTVSYSFAPYSVGDSLVAVETGVSDNVIVMDEHGNVGRQFPIGENVNGYCGVRIMGNYMWLFGKYLNTDAFIAKYNLATGQQLWRVNVTNMTQQRGDVDSLGNSYFGCSKYATGISYRMKLMKLSPSGSLLWDKEWFINPQWDSVGNQNIFAYTISHNLQKGIVVIGGGAQRDSVNNGWRHAYFCIRKVSNGDSLYAVKFANNPAKQLNEVRSIAFTPENKMVVMGVQIFGSGGINTGWLRRYIADSLTGVQNQNEIAEKFSLFQNYPNPFNANTALSFQLPVVSDVRLAVYDILGREVTVLVDGKMTKGTHEVEFDGNSLSSGVYFYRIEAGDFTETKKMILLK